MLSEGFPPRHDHHPRAPLPARRRRHDPGDRHPRVRRIPLSPAGLRERSGRTRSAKSLSSTSRLTCRSAETGRRCGLLARLPADPGDGCLVQRGARRDSSATRPTTSTSRSPMPSGRVVSSALPFTGEVSVRDRPFFSRTLEAKSFAVGLFDRNPISPRTGLNMGCPLFGPGGTASAASSGRRSRSTGRRTLLPAPSCRPGAALLVLDSQGTVLMRSLGGDQWIGRSVAAAELFERIERRRIGDRGGAQAWTACERLHAFTQVKTGAGACRRARARLASRRRPPRASRGRRSSAISASC